MTNLEFGIWNLEFVNVNSHFAEFQIPNSKFARRSAR